MEAPEGIEPPTNRFVVCCSGPMSYGAVNWRIGPGRAGDLLGFNQALYVVSYRPVNGGGGEDRTPTLLRARRASNAVPCR